MTPEAEEIAELVAAVNRDMPSKPIEARMREAMRRCKGHLDPARVRAALEG